jgi:mRNA-degrading endonuclease RelE of RelBE toxin-antitoxin system
LSPLLTLQYKVRIKNSNAKKGKSGGYRIIYYLKSQNNILLITLYSKSDRTDIAIETIVDIIAAYEKQFLPEP